MNSCNPSTQKGIEPDLSQTDDRLEPPLPNVSIVVLNWNNYEDTASCLRSLAEVSYPEMEVYVVDNGSTDGSHKRLAEEFEQYNFIFNSENLGFAGGCNQAIKRVLKEGTDYVLLLNNDTVVQPDFLTPLVETAEREDDVAAVGGIIRDMSGGVQSAGGSFNPWLATLRHRENPESSVYETDFITGAMMLIEAEFLASLDGLNDSYFFGMEDQELCWKADQRDLRLLIEPRSVVRHDKGGSASEASPFRYYHDTRNRLRFVGENISFAGSFLFYIFFAFSRIYRFGQWILSGRTGFVTATLSGAFDHIRGAEYRMTDDF
ncbi:glycosyltransferase family 2 protein [Natronoarchaeum mannanilyticum]|uniref:Glycosyltransferase 2-like domain-containing protein n=1 Tax=Natronoarchaeum mannanilyticum TaxID=926360 RepID=A0AAV3T8V3_9EURY